VSLSLTLTTAISRRGGVWIRIRCDVFGYRLTIMSLRLGAVVSTSFPGFGQRTNSDNSDAKDAQRLVTTYPPTAHVRRPA